MAAEQSPNASNDPAGAPPPPGATPAASPADALIDQASIGTKNFGVFL